MLPAIITLGVIILIGVVMAIILKEPKE